jgi:hypothetical protein
MIINLEFIPLALEVFSSKESLRVKQEYLKTLLSILVEYPRLNEKIPKQLTDFLLENDINLEDEWVWAHNHVSTISSTYYLNTIKSLSVSESEDVIFTSCVNYKANSAKIRETFSYSIKKYIEYKVNSSKSIPYFITFVVMEMLHDNYFLVRRNALKCLLFIYKVSPSEMFKNELIRMTIDNSPYIKGYYVSQLSKGIIANEITNELLALFTKDASYTIREKSKKYLKNNKFSEQESDEFKSLGEIK